MDYKFSLAEETDALELSLVKCKCWNTTYRGIYPDHKLDNFDIEDHKNEFIKIIKDKTKKIYKITIDNKIIGYFEYGSPIRNYKDFKQEIGVFYILKEYQHKGIGKSAFKFAYEDMKKNNYKEFIISCNKYNFNAQKFYQKMGGKIDSIDEDKKDGSSQIHYYFKIV